jgi:AraC family transcriptional regulator
MTECTSGRLLVQNHHYWHKKQQFLLNEDRYPCWVVFAVEEGRFRYQIGGDIGEAAFGDWVVCPPETSFRREVLQPLSFHFLWLEWIVLPETLPSGKISIQDTERLISSYRYLRKLSELEAAQADAWKNRFVRDIWNSYVLQQLLTDDNASVTADALMLSARRTIKQRAFGPLSMRRMAEEAGLSPVQFTRRFKVAFGYSASSYLKRLRLDLGKALLTDTVLTVDEIAVRCGYENGFYFSRVFSQHVRMSPSEYRRTHRL